MRALCGLQKHKEQEEERKKVCNAAHQCHCSWVTHSPAADHIHLAVSAAPQKEEAEAAKLYAEFVQSFGEEAPEGNAGPKPFVRSHTILPGSSVSQAGMHHVPPHALLPARSC